MAEKKFKTESLTSVQARAKGYAIFNGNMHEPGATGHLAVDLPDGWSTITARTSAGERITFAFMSYKNEGPPQCVDIVHHGPTFTLKEFDGDGKTRHKYQPQNVRLFGWGNTVYSSDDTYDKAIVMNDSEFQETTDEERPPVLTCVLFEEKKLSQRK